MKLLTAATLLLASSTVVASPAPLVSIASHDAFLVILLHIAVKLMKAR